MNKDKINGAMDDAAGRIKRQTGEWTGDANKQVEGAAQQVKGKAEKISGNVKDAVRNAADKARADQPRNEDREREHENTGHRH